MITLHSGGAAVVVSPERGGAIQSWTLTTDGECRSILAGHPTGETPAAFLMVPYCNRIAFGRFSWRNAPHQLDLNFGEHPHAIHGVGWQRAWVVDSVSETSIALSLRHSGDTAWPFAFDAALAYDLAPDSLSVTMRVTNWFDGPAPAGIGFHPYFPRRAGDLLTFRAAGVWMNDPDALPRAHGPVPPSWDHAAGRPVGAAVLDNCFTGWDGRAALGGKSAPVLIEADTVFGNLQVFTPDGADFFCVEPVTHAPDALNRAGSDPGQAMRTLTPGESLTGVIRLSTAVSGTAA